MAVLPYRLVHDILKWFIYYTAIREEIREIEEGKYDKDSNVLKVNDACPLHRDHVGSSSCDCF